MSYFSLKKIVFAFVFFFAMSNWSFAKIIYVPMDSSTVQAGINGATDGDTVLVAPGIYYENINFRGKSILVASHFILDSDTNTMMSTIIDGSQPADSRKGSVVTFSAGEDSLSILKGFTLQNGTSTGVGEFSYGGGIYCTSSPSILNNRILANTAHFGAGICARGQESSPKIANNIVIQNEGVVGAGIFCEFSKPQIAVNLVRDNQASYRGGGIFCKLTHSLIMGNKVLENKSSARGGGIHMVYSSGKIIDNYVAFNQTGERGGGIYVGVDSTLLIQRNLIHQNEAPKGGGIYITNCNSQIINNTLSDNLADLGGGVFYQGSHYTEIINNIIANSSKGGGLVCMEGSYVRISYNDVWYNIGGNFIGCGAGIGNTSWGFNLNNTPCDSLYNIIQNPLFVTGDSNYHFSCLSPCRDAGAPYFDVPSGGGVRIDMGASEYVPIPGDISGDEKINAQDILLLIDFLFKRKPAFCAYDAGDVNRDNTVDIVDVVYLINFIFKEGPPPFPPIG